MEINPKSNMRLWSRKVFEVCLVAAILILIGIFAKFKTFEAQDISDSNDDRELEITEIPETEQEKKPPPPAAPSVPVESEDEEFLDDVTIEDTDFSLADYSDAPPPPLRIEDETIPDFLSYENLPKPIGGLKGIEKKIVYPEIARKAGIQGKVSIRVYVDKEGNPIRCEVVKSLGNNGCDEAAIKAIMATKFTPAMQRDRAIPFSVVIPITFQLKGGGGH